MILAVTNGVNLTDGLDGLAAGSSLFAFVAYVVIGFWAFRNPGYQVEHALDLAVVAAAMLGAVRRLPLVERGARPRSSWATPARSRSAPGWRAWPS